MANKHNVKLTKGEFKIAGNVKMAKDPSRFFKNYAFDNSSKNTLNVGIITAPENESYVRLEGFTQKTAKFNKYDKKTKQSSKKEVSWSTRFESMEELQKDGYNPSFGTRINMSGEKDGLITLFQYDACEELKDSLEDGMSVYVEGNTSFTSYKKGDEVKRNRNLDITKIYKQHEPIDFNEPTFKEQNSFRQTIIFMGIEQEKDFETDKPTGRGIVSAKIVTPETVEDAEFIVEKKVLIGKIKSNLKPYNAIEVIGRFTTKIEKEEPAEQVSNDGWGDDDSFEDNSSHQVKFREWIITKANPETIDKETYSEAVLLSITQAEEDYGDLGSVEEDGDDVW